MFPSFRVPCSCIQIRMSEDLSQSDEVARVGFEITVSHGMPKQMRVELDADEGRVFAAQRTDASLAKRTTLPNENLLIFHGRSSF